MPKFKPYPVKALNQIRVWFSGNREPIIIKKGTVGKVVHCNLDLRDIEYAVNFDGTEETVIIPADNVERIG